MCYNIPMNIRPLFDRKTVFSVEVFPPKKSGTMENVIRALRKIASLSPDFVSITCGAGGNGGATTSDVCSVAVDAFDLNAVAHFTCVNMTAAHCLEELEILSRKGIDNILVLRGDVGEQSRFYEFAHADKLAAFIKANRPEFNLIGACYPEGHVEADSLEADVDNVRRKVDAGVTHLITQLFFDNRKFFAFRELAAKKGVGVPVEAGVMPVLHAEQIKRMVEMCGASIPYELSRIIALYGGEPAGMETAGIDYAAAQIEDLLREGVDGIHLYSMNRADAAETIWRRVRT